MTTAFEAAQAAGSAGSTGVAGSTGRVRRTGDRLLREVRTHFGRYVSTLDESDLDLLTLWAAHTHLCFETYTTPRLLLDSPMPGSGKTTVLEHFERLCMHPVQMASVSSPALLVRLLDAAPRTLLIDEVDRTLSSDRDGVAELLAVLNSGYKRGATRPVLVPSKAHGHEAKEMSTFAPVAMAGNNPTLPDDTRSRSLRVLLMPDIDGRIEESDWELIDAAARELGTDLAVWADSVREQIRTGRRPPLPEQVRGRNREKWSPLLRVAVAAGGDWPDVVANMAMADVERIAAEREEGIVNDKPAIVLIRHLHDLFEDREVQFLPTGTVIDWLVGTHPDVWSENSAYGKRLTPQRLGRMLVTAFNVHSSRPDHERGYLLATLRQAFRRSGLRDLPVEPATPVEPAEPALLHSEHDDDLHAAAMRLSAAGFRERPSAP